MTLLTTNYDELLFGLGKHSDEVSEEDLRRRQDDCKVNRYPVSDLEGKGIIERMT